MIEIVEAPPDAALEFWGEIEPHVVAALRFDAYNILTMDSLKEQIKQGYARVILCAEPEQILAVTVVTLFLNTSDDRILHVIATGGEASYKWLEALCAFLHDMAARENCQGVTMAGRPGWARKLNKYGFRMDMVSMRMEVTDGLEQKPTALRVGEPGTVNHTATANERGRITPIR